MESSLRVRWQLVKLLQKGKLLGFQGIAPSTKKIQCLAVPEENDLLALMDDQLGAQVEIFNRVLPHQGFIIPLIFNNTCQAFPADLLRHQPFRNIIHKVADRTGIGGGPLIYHQPHAALAAGELLHLGLFRLCIDRLMADRA